MMEVSLKRTRRVEIIRYTRRVTRMSDDTDATAKAESAAAIGVLSTTPEGNRSEVQLADFGGQAARSEARATQRRPWFWLNWLKRD